MDSNPKYAGLIREEGFKILSEKADLIAKNKRLRELLQEIAYASPVFDDERVGYLEIQVPRVTILKARRLLEREEAGSE